MINPHTQRNKNSPNEESKPVNYTSIHLQIFFQYRINY